MSVHRGEVLLPGGCLILGGAWSRGVLGPRGVPAPEGSGPGGAWWRPPGRLLLRAVRILLECIVLGTVSTTHHSYLAA